MGWQDIPGRHAMGWIIDEALERTRTGGIWVEVGVALGKGIAIMARRLIDAQREDVTLYAVDPWAGLARNGEQQASGPPTRHSDWDLFLGTMQRCAPEELRRVNVLRLESTRAARAFSDFSIDLCLIDADHAYEAVCEDLGAWIPKVRSGGIIGGDDHHEEEFPGVPRACRQFFGDRYEVREDAQYQWPCWAAHIGAEDIA
jgi:hypothetical protein